MTQRHHGSLTTKKNKKIIGSKHKPRPGGFQLTEKGGAPVVIETQTRCVQQNEKNTTKKDKGVKKNKNI